MREEKKLILEILKLARITNVKNKAIWKDFSERSYLWKVKKQTKTQPVHLSFSITIIRKVYLWELVASTENTQNLIIF